MTMRREQQQPWWDPDSEETKIVRLTEAVEILELESEIELAVTLDHACSRPRYRRWQPFARFLAALYQNRSIQYLEFKGWGFDHPIVLEGFRGNDDGPVDVIALLFIGVLLQHPTWNRIAFTDCRFSFPYVEMLKNVVGNREHSLRVLQLRGTPLNHQGAMAFANFLGVNSKIESLELQRCGLDSTWCQALLEALDGNTHLRKLDLDAETVSSINLTCVQAIGNSNLRTLILCSARLEHESIQSMVEMLKTNILLEELYLVCSSGSFELVEGLLATFNFTLRRVTVTDNTFSYYNPVRPTPQQDRLDALLQFNHQVRRVHDQLESLGYHLPSHRFVVTFWPDVLACISSKPNLLYRFLRHGNVDKFASHCRDSCSVSISGLRGPA